MSIHPWQHKLDPSTKPMKLLSFLITFLSVTRSLVLADGIPVDHETGKISVKHSVVSLTADQIEETQTLGTFTLTPDQWREIRAKSPQCPKRFNTILPVTWNDCTCCVDDEYVIALSRDRIAVLHCDEPDVSLRAVRYELFKDRRVTTLRMNERGEFHLGGMLIPFPTLLKTFAEAPEGSERNEQGKLMVTVSEYGKVYQCSRGLDVDLPIGAKPTDAVFASRLKQVAAAANQMGFRVLFAYGEDESDE
jgi:hypothetical protein